MLIFGGFVNGERVNDIYRYYFKENKWEKVQNLGEQSPSPRAGHSAIIYGDSMIIFGGTDEEKDKLNDTWEFNLTNNQWRKLEASDPPLPRSGHSACLYKDLMIIFGGIFEVTKELDDVVLYDFKNRRWLVFFEELISPVKFRNSASSPDGSPASK